MMHVQQNFPQRRFAPPSWWLAASLLACALHAAPTAAAPREGPGALLLGIGAGAATRDLMSVADIRPLSRGESVAEVELGYRLGQAWQVGVCGRFGGSWFDFRQVETSSGNIKDQDLTVRGAVDRVMPCGAATSAQVGIGVEYGQARSFTYTRFFDDEGPRTYYLGGLMRVGLSHAVHARLQLHTEVTQSVFRAHAEHASLASDSHWLGRSLSMTVGLRTVLIRGRAP